MKIKVFQINHEKDVRNLAFSSYDFTAKHGGVKPEEYKCVFDGYLNCTELEGVYTALNSDERPGNYRGHSLSKSDIVVVETGAEPDWDSFMRTKEGRSYIMARMVVGEAFSDILSDEMSAFPDVIVDPISNTLYDESQAIHHVYGDAPILEFNAVKPYVLPLINQMSSWVPEQILNNHGWTKDNLRIGIAQHIFEPMISQYAVGHTMLEDAKIDSDALEMCEEIKEYKWNHTDEFKDNAKYIPYTQRGAYFCDTIGFEKIEFDAERAEDLQGLRCLEFQPGKPPFVTHIPDDLDELQNAVSRYRGEDSRIQLFNPENDNVVFMCNMESKLIGMEYNREVGSDIVAGPMYIFGDKNECLTDLTDEQIQQYNSKYAKPVDTNDPTIQALGSYFTQGM